MKKTPLKRENRPRKAENHLRAYGGPERIAWIQRQPSVVSGAIPCVNAHVKTGGAGRKADARWIVPLTDAEHQELHRIGQRSFEAAHQIDLFALATIVDARWEQYRATITPREGQGAT